jgi:hypothetical protein
MNDNFHEVRKSENVSGLSLEKILPLITQITSPALTCMT